MFRRSLIAPFASLLIFIPDKTQADVPSQIIGPVISHSPTGNFFYDYQALIGTCVALITILVTFLISEKNRRQDWKKFRFDKEIEKEKKAIQTNSFYYILKEDLELLKQDVEDQIFVIRDLCVQLSDVQFSAGVSMEHIRRVVVASKPRIGTALIDDWKIVEFLSDPNVAQYLERVNSYLKNLEKSIDWCKDSMLEMKSSNAFEDVDDVKNYVEARGSQLLAAIEQLRESLAAR